MVVLGIVGLCGVALGGAEKCVGVGDAAAGEQLAEEDVAAVGGGVEGGVELLLPEPVSDGECAVIFPGEARDEGVQLPHVRQTCGALALLAAAAERGEDEAGKDCNDRDDDEQLDQREGCREEAGPEVQGAVSMH